MLEQAFTLVLDAKGMGSVVDHFQTISVGNLLDTLDVARIAVTMHRHDGRGLGGNGGLDPVGIKIHGCRIDIDENRLNIVPKQ